MLSVPACGALTDELGDDSCVHRTPHGEMELNLPPLLLCAGRVRPPGLDFVFAHAVRHEARAHEVLTKLGDERRVAESELHRPQMFTPSSRL